MRLHLFARSASAIVFVYKLGAVEAEAQSPLKARSDRVASSATVPARNWLANARGDAATGARIVATGAPSTFQIVTIPLPAELPRFGNGSVEVIPREGFRIIGQHRWSLPALSGKASIVAIIGIPASARFGVATGADVRIDVPGSPTVSIAVEFDVQLVTGLSVRLSQATLNGRTGSPATLSYELVNTGNATETVDVVVSAPAEWNLKPSSGEASIEPGSSIRRKAVVHIPRNIGSGSFFLRLDLLDKGVLRSSVPITLEVDGATTNYSSVGPEITIAVARAANRSYSGSTLTTASIRGPLFDSVRIDATLSVGEGASGPFSQAFSRLGSYSSSPSVALSSPFGRLAVGAASSSFSDLTGLYAYGRGAALEAHRPGWHLVGLGAMSIASPSAGAAQPMAGLRADVGLGRITVMSSLSHLRGGDRSGRQLDAMGLGASMAFGATTTLQAELARRRFDGGGGTGWSSEISRTDAETDARVRITHAPGGSDAFARATDEIVGNVSRALSRRMSMIANAWRTSDETIAFSNLGSSGWSLRSEYLIHPTTRVSVEARSSGVRATTKDSRDMSTGYGGGERQFSAGVNSVFREFYLSGSIAGGTLDRKTLTAAAGEANRRSPEILWNASAAWRGVNTTAEIRGRLDETRNVGGEVVRQSNLSLRGTQSLATVFGSGSTGDIEVEQLRGFSRNATMLVRSGVSIPVTSTLGIKLYAERNSQFATLSGDSPWTFAVRFQHSARVPMVRPPGTTGYVYRDINGNGKREAGEPGVEGAVLTRGKELAVSDAAGKYRLGGDKRADVVLDEASLPLGWVREPAASADIPVGAALTAEIHFIVAPRVGDAAELQVDLSGIRAVARDAMGREWQATMTGSNVATFGALPVGNYSLALDVSAVDEPLVPQTKLPTIAVTTGITASVTIRLDPRPVRMWMAEPKSAEKRAPTPSK
ncbi:MAG TPA: NEW3 domain-containing protein [Gemmatimonadaceae bacterium]|nr:NEW3 domain-containing protein [Gemmatimonadaceae bacterium]